MKKLFSLLLALCLMVSCCAVAMAESDALEFDPGLTNAAEYSTSEWCESAKNRALLYGCLVFDMYMADVLDEQFELSLAHDVYVGRTASEIVLFFCNDETLLTLIYSPVLGTAYYMLTETTSAELYAELACDEICLKSYTISQLDQADALEELLSALKNL
ncbi:MAG: hypothetical protein E7324_00210 [Clostridiales bacterium]|nr:hypothetical protein [Clostridiales bacterium]